MVFTLVEELKEWMETNVEPVGETEPENEVHAVVDKPDLQSKKWEEEESHVEKFCILF